MEVLIDLVEQDIDIETLYQWVLSPEAGSIVAFTGTVRNNSSNKSVTRLEFEAYLPMAKKELRKIVDKISADYDIIRVAIQHRIGILPVGGVAVYIAVATPHRAEGFTVCKYIIDTLKKTVPIWKKEVFEDGEVWVSANP